MSTVIPPQYLQIVGAIALWLFTLNLIVQALIKLFPNVRWLAVVGHYTAAISNWIPKTWLPPPTPVVGSRVSPGAGNKGILGLYFSPMLIVLAVAASMLVARGARAQVTWTTPVLTAGPAAAISEFNFKTGQSTSLGAGAGYQLTLGVGSYQAFQKSWDVVDFSVLALGSVLFPSGAPVGQLQLGGCIGTLNGMLMGCGLGTPYAQDGSGFAQGGRPGFTGAVVANIQTIVAYLSNFVTGEDGRVRLALHLPRGGL